MGHGTRSDIRDRTGILDDQGVQRDRRESERAAKPTRLLKTTAGAKRQEWLVLLDPRVILQKVGNAINRKEPVARENRAVPGSLLPSLVESALLFAAPSPTATPLSRSPGPSRGRFRDPPPIRPSFALPRTLVSSWSLLSLCLHDWCTDEQRNAVVENLLSRGICYRVSFLDMPKIRDLVVRCFWEIRTQIRDEPIFMR